MSALEQLCKTGLSLTPALTIMKWNRADECFPADQLQILPACLCKGILRLMG